jgi:hypothetical protein
MLLLRLIAPIARTALIQTFFAHKAIVFAILALRLQRKRSAATHCLGGTGFMAAQSSCSGL